MNKQRKVRHILKSIRRSYLVSMILLWGTLWAVKLARRKEGITEKHFAVVQIFLLAGNNIRLKLHICIIQGR